MTSLSKFAVEWPAISALLDEALSLPATEHATWLASLVGERAAHREALRTLLAHRPEVETDDFLREIPQLDIDAADRPAGGLAEGSHVGAYRLISELGRGGMGTVWLAERSDGMMKRRVALKLPRVVWGDAFAERLAREREILATLEHEHIARLYDAGVDAHGRPFLAMEYVEGESIDAYCRAHSLPVRERVALLLQVMAAVSHAHARLIVHRDLKPGNILVTGDAQVKLLDFGIAKLLEGDLTRETALTELSGHALTLDYASPEQIRGEPLGTASDVYSMAVVAYEVLAGARPYRLKRAGAAELEDAIAKVESPSASASATDGRIARQLRGDLDAILNRALKKALAERYSTMDGFASDLRRYLAGEPVEARPDGLAYRTAKFVRRHRLQVSAGALVGVALIAGVTVALWQAHEARLQAQRARAEAATAEAVQGFLEGVFLTNSSDQVDPKKARETTARELLDRGAQRIETELLGAPQARLRLLDSIASMYESMDLVDRQIALRREQLKETRSISGPTSDDSVIVMARLADALAMAEQRQEAAALLRDAAALLDARHDNDSRARFWVEVMQASLDRNPDPRHGLAAAERALAIARHYPPDAGLLLALECQGDNASFIGDYERARQAYAESIRISEEHSPLGAAELALMHGSLAHAQIKLGLFAEAEASQRKGVELARRRGEPQRTHESEVQLAALLYDSGRFRESLEAAEPAWQWAHSAEASMFPQPAHWIKTRYAQMLLYYGRAQDALAATDGDASLTLGPQSEASDLDLTNLNVRAWALTDLGRLKDAREVLDRSHSLLKHANGRLSSTPTGRAERHWLVASGRAAEALADLQASRLAAKQPATPDANAPLQHLTESALFQEEAGHAAVAEKLARAALATIAAGGAVKYQQDREARATFVLGKALMLQQRVDEARPLLERAVSLHLAVYDPQHSRLLADAWRTLAACRKLQGDARGAAQATREAVRIDSRSGVRRAALRDVAFKE